MGDAQPLEISGSYGNHRGFRLLLCALLFAVAAVTSVCVRASLDWIDRPFNGFLMGQNRIVAPIDLPSWTGRKADIPYWWQLTAIDGRPISTTDEAFQAAADAGAGATLRYRFSDGSDTVEVPIEVMVFSVGDWFGLFANYLVNGLALLAIGFFVAFLRPGLKSAHALLVFSLSWGISLVIGLADFRSFHFRTLLAIAEGFVPASLFYLTLCFPTERPLRQRRGLLWVITASSALLAALNVVLYEAAPHAWTIAYRAAVVWVALVILLSVRIAWREHRAAEPIAREKLKIVLVGIVAAFALPFLLLGASQLIGADLPLNVVTAGWWIFPATLAYAIVQRDLFQIDVFLRRVATYVALSAAVLLAYAAVLAVSNYIFHNLGLASSPWFALSFSLAVLVAFHPLRDRLQAGVDRLFFRTHFDYAAITQDLSQALNRTLDVEHVADTVADFARRTMSPLNVRLYRAGTHGFELAGREAAEPELRLDAETVAVLAGGHILDAATKLPEATRRDLPPTALILPLRFEDRLEGILALGPKQSGATYGPRDLELLRTLANQTAMALRNAASYERVTELADSLETRVGERTQELQRTQAELRQSNEKLRELDRVKTQFFADASHELRTPLTLVLGPLEELGRKATELTPASRRLVELARANAATLLVLTDTLLDISRLDSGQMQPSLRSEPVRPLVESTTEPFLWLAEQRGVALRTKVDEVGPVHCDRAMLAKILGNLLANALKFTSSGSVEIGAAQRGEQIQFTVADTGPGIPAEELALIFDRYRQVSTAANSSFAGSGIGLALVRELSEAQGGSVSVASEVGSGTTFTVALPAAGAADAGTVAPSSASAELRALAAASRTHIGEAPPARAADGRESILVVDDNAEMLDFVRQVLSADYRVRAVADANQALAALRSAAFDLVISDVMMPGPDGIALCHTLKEDAELARVPLILLTARASIDSKLSGLAAGADDYITKPFHPEELIARAAALLRTRRIEGELRQSHEQLARAYQDLRAAQAQLIHSEKMAALGTLVAGVAHEINNPVSFIHSSIDLISASIEELRETLETRLDDANGSADGLREWSGDGERFDTLLQNAQICKEGAQRAARIVQDLRAFSRPDTDGRQPTDIHASLEQSLRLLQGELKGRVSIQRDYGELPMVVCNAGQIAQVFLNLLANALQAIPDKGKVTLHTSRTGDDVEVEIRDDGSGMAADTVDKIFDPFFTTKEVGKGTGLGLSIVRSLVDAHGGEIRVDSALGKGTTFTVVLPTNGVTHEQLDISA